MGIFAKHWQPGAVKTRLAATIGPLRASALSRAMLEATLQRFAPFGHQRWLAYAPDAARQEFTAYASLGWKLVPQPGGGLGERISGYFDFAFAEGATRVVLIGSDSPTLPCAFVETAFAALRSHRVVLGPALDGGYYLIGMSQPIPEMFASIDWSTSSVLAQTCTRLASQGIAPKLLDTWYDVDVADDLHRLRRDLRNCEEPAYRSLRTALASCADAE